MKSSYLILFLLAGLTVFFSIYSSGKSSTADISSQTELVLRKIGHEILLSSGDDSSRVMPVRKMADYQYQVYFQNKLMISHDSLVRIVNRIFSEKGMPADYAVNVIDCIAKDTVYGFAVFNTSKDSLLACGGRKLPLGCYYLDIQFVAKENNSTTLLYSLTGLIAFAGLSLALVKRRKKENPVLQAAIKKSAGNTNLVSIGKYNFNTDQHYIEWNGTRTILTNKESKLLFIFSLSQNEIISREKLQKEVWENEGVIVTRSLDMFVSKLRKKLQEDDSVRIVNFPGKGYMLEVIS